MYERLQKLLDTHEGTGQDASDGESR